MSSRYFDDEDDLEVRVIRQRSRSPAPQYYTPPEPQYRHTRPAYHEAHSYGGHGYVRASGELLIPAVTGGLRRSRSQGRRTPPPMFQQPQVYQQPQVFQQPPQQVFHQQQQPQPVIINKIYNDRDEDDDYRHHQLAPVHPHGRPHSGSFSVAPPRDSRDDWELEKARKELAAYKLDKEKKEEEKRIKKELELERLRKEKEEEEEEEKLKAERKKAIDKYKVEEAEKAAKAKKEKEEREKEYQRRLEEDLKKSGLDQRQISVVLNKDKQVASDPNRPTYTRMSRRHLSIETLNKYRIDYEFDHDPDYVLIKRWVPEYEQDFLWSHTREIRERRTTLLTIEAKEKHKKHGHSHGKEEVEFEFVRKTKRERKPSPSPLLNFLAGGKR